MAVSDEPKTFRGASMAEAMAELKRALGREAIILSTRVVERRQWLGLRRREVYEITAGRGLSAAKRPPLKAVFAQVPQQAAVAQPTLMQSPAVSNAALLSISKEMDSLKTMVKDLVGHVRADKNPQVPAELFDHYLSLIECQVAEEYAREIIATLQRNHRPELLTDVAFVREKMAEAVEKLIPVAGPIRRTKSVGPHVVALIGPTGVGKTTTIAKLAAHLKLREKRRVALITLDTFRIAAIDQLRRYAEILQVPLKVVATPDDIAAAIAAMGEYDYVLIDTAGRSPNDALKLGELRSFIERANPDEVHLVLASTCGQRAMELAIEKFGDIRIDRVLFTKIDEASELGVILNVSRKLNKALSYITTGQDVPNDIEIGQGRALARRIIDGDKSRSGATG